MSDSRMINVGGHKVGVVGLDQVLQEMAPGFADSDDPAVAAEMLDRLGRRNYIPAAAKERYGAAFVREFRRCLGQPHEPAPRSGLEVKVLGPGCPQCRQAYERVVGVLSRLGLAADLEEIKDAKAIAASGVLVTPGIMINGKVVSVGKAPSEQDLEKWLQEAGGK